MALFALIHGAWHSGAHWDPLIPEIEARGHRAVAMDLPCETAFVDAYIEPASQAIEAARDGDNVIVVGHSLGGLTAPHVADRVGAAHRVYLCALLQRPGKTVAEFLAEETGFVPDDFLTSAITNDDGTLSWDSEVAKSWFYHDCSASDAERAASLLRRQNLTASDQPPPVDLKAGPSTYILCTEDRVVLPEWSRKRALDWLGVEPIEIGGSHSPFLSRPGELADILASLA